jgi:hypothetical protein
MIMSDVFLSSRPLSFKHACGSNPGSARRGVADWLCLAATPTFAMMALLTAFDGGQQDVLCAAFQHTSSLGGMAPMYLLMSAFHSAPWLRLIFPSHQVANQ